MRRSLASLLLEIADGVALVTFNRPQVFNAFDPEIIVRLASAWDEIENRDDVRVAIVTGAGDKAFSVGADLGRLTPLTSGQRLPADEWDRKFLDGETANRAMLRGQFSMSKPIIAAINGYCFAGALELMTAFDIRIASETSSFALQEVKWGLIPARGALARLPRQIAYCHAMELMLTAEKFTGPDALRIGLVNYILPANQVMDRAIQLARAIRNNGPLAIRRLKKSAHMMMGATMAEAYRIEDEAFAEIMSSEDAKEGPRAFLEKRKPLFKGK